MIMNKNVLENKFNKIVDLVTKKNVFEYHAFTSVMRGCTKEEKDYVFKKCKKYFKR